MTQAAALRQTEEIAARYRNATPEVTGAIRQASVRTGVDFAYLMEKAAVESGFRTDVRASTSSATGLYQFVERTWLDMVERHGAKYGLEREAGEIRRRPDGGAFVTEPEARQRILELRKDPRLAAAMAAEYARENRDHLRRTVGGDIGSTELYMAHFLGPAGAERFIGELRRNPNGTAADLMPEAARANRGVFYRDGRALTLAQVHERFQARFQGSMVAAGTAPAPAPETVAERVVRGNAMMSLRRSPDGAEAEEPAAGPAPRSPIGGQSYFTVMMLAQLSSPLEGERRAPSPALGGRREEPGPAGSGMPGDRRDDPAKRVMMPFAGT